MTSRNQPDRHTKRPPLDAESLERLAIHYVGRYATTRAKLRSYLERKLNERGWAGESAAPVAALVERLAELRYVDDASFATARAAALARRGFGVRRQRQALRAAGIEGDDLGAAQDDEEARWEAALAFARRRRIGPYAPEPPSREERQKQFAALMRAGHGSEEARRVLDTPPECPKEKR